MIEALIGISFFGGGLVVGSLIEMARQMRAPGRPVDPPMIRRVNHMRGWS